MKKAPDSASVTFILMIFLYDSRNKKNFLKTELTWHFLQPFEFSSSHRTVNVSKKDYYYIKIYLNRH